MTTTQTPDTVERPTVPDWRLSDRFRRAVEHGRVDPSELATECGVSVATIYRYINGATRPRRAALSLRAEIDGTRHFVAARSVVHVLPIP